MIRELRPDVYDITVAERDGSRYRIFLFDGPTPTLVDAGFADTTSVLVDRLSDIGVEPQRLVVTHADEDHVGGLPDLVDRYGLETWVPEGADFGDHEPDNRFGDGDEIGRFVAVHTPGHRSAHYALVDEDDGVAVLGDAVFGSDARGLPDGYFILPPGHYTDDLDAADESLPRLLEYEFDLGLVFHGSSVTSEASEVLDDFVAYRE